MTREGVDKGSDAKGDTRLGILAAGRARTSIHSHLGQRLRVTKFREQMPRTSYAASYTTGPTARLLKMALFGTR